MDVQIVERESLRYLELISSEPPLRTEEDALTLVSLCGENDTNLLMAHQKALSEDFFQLKTGVAGAMMQKFINYSIKVGVIVPDQTGFNIRFQELVSEVNNANQYRIFASGAEAENWFLKR